MSSFHLFSYRSTIAIMILLSRLIFSYYLAYNLTALITYLEHRIVSSGPAHACFNCIDRTLTGLFER